MDVSIIIVNYHSSEMVIDCINSIHAKTQNVSFEVIVVDNASNDGSVERLRDTFGDKIKLIASPENLGFGKANNLGAAEASGDYLFLLNPDTILVNNAIGILHQYMRNNPKVGVAGGNLFSPDLTPASSFCREFDDLLLEKKRASWSKLVGDRIKAKLHIGSNNPLAEFNHAKEPQKVAYIFGADMMMPRTVFEKVNGFDPDFFMYGEEEELTWRITAQGYDVISVSEAKIIHLEGATLNASHTFNPRQFKMRMTGTLTYYFKRFGQRGVEEFFRIRCLRYDRIIAIAKMQGKYKPDSITELQKQYLTEAYREFTLKGDN